MKKNNCYLCGDDRLVLIHILEEKPQAETNFGIHPGEYRREIYQCPNCGAFNNFHEYNLDELYRGNYNQATYESKVFEKYCDIMEYPFEKSDNKQRVQRIIKHFNTIENLSVLDVGSGLCVFLGEMLKYGIEADCIDPDPISIEHALENVGVNSAFKGMFGEFTSSKKYDLITFNKVLEHVVNPVELLMKAKGLLKNGGSIYIELPDGDNALANGDIMTREEFYIEHYTIHNEKSMRYMSNKFGSRRDSIGAIHEPSDKYTVFGFFSYF